MSFLLHIISFLSPHWLNSGFQYTQEANTIACLENDMNKQQCALNTRESLSQKGLVRYILLSTITTYYYDT